MKMIFLIILLFSFLTSLVNAQSYEDRGINISGYLKDKNSSTITGARVELRMGTYPKAVSSTNSDGRGIFSF